MFLSQQRAGVESVYSTKEISDVAFPNAVFIFYFLLVSVLLLFFPN